MKIFLLIFLPILFVTSSPTFASNNHVRTITVAPDQLVTVNGAVGIATIIQIPDGVQNVITGDSGAFKIEYLDKAITTKPLRYAAKTNLYVNTKLHRYNLRLLTVGQPLADYVIYINDFVPRMSNAAKWIDYRESSSSKSVSLRVEQIGKTKAGFVLIRFSLESTKDQDFDPTSIWLYQNNDKRPLEGIFLTDATLEKGKPIQGIASINSLDLTKNLQATLELSSPEKIKIEIDKDVLWKK